MTTRRIVILSEAKDLCPCIRNRHRRSIPGGKIDSNINTYSNERKDRAEMMQSAASELLQRIEQRGAVVGIIGLGYVGLPCRSNWRAPVFASSASTSMKRASPR